MKIALVGDFNEEVIAHRAIPKAIEINAPKPISFEWIHSNDVNLELVSAFSGIWCVPASPYANMQNVLDVIQYARTNDVPFIGTCGGYQHAALEFSRNVLGYAEADNAEVFPETTMPLISGLACKLYGETGVINFPENSLVRTVYGAASITEEYQCGFGVNPAYLSLFDGNDMQFTGFDNDGDPRVLEIRSNRFFVGTAFQPERSALKGETHPLIQRFIQSLV